MYDQPFCSLGLNQWGFCHQQGVQINFPFKIKNSWRDCLLCLANNSCTRCMSKNIPSFPNAPPPPPSPKLGTVHPMVESLPPPDVPRGTTTSARYLLVVCWQEQQQNNDDEMSALALMVAAMTAVAHPPSPKRKRIAGPSQELHNMSSDDSAEGEDHRQHHKNDGKTRRH